MTDTPAFDADTLEQIDVLLDAINTGFADTMALVARWAEADDAVTASELTSIDPLGVVAEIETPRGRHAVRIDFADPIRDLAGLESAMLGLVDQARAARPTEPLTSIERRLEQSELQPTYRCQVVAIRDLGPRLRSLTLGPLPAWDDLGGDQSMTIFLDLPGRPVPETIKLSELRELDDEVRPKGATYSIRRHDPVAQTVDVWVVRHDDDPATVSGWAASVSVGDPATLWGPRRANEPMGGVERLVAVCDETGLAASLAILGERSEQSRAELVIEVDGPQDEFDLDISDVEVTWCHRGDRAPGTSSVLLDDLTERVTSAAGVAVFGAGESRTMAAIRRHLRNDVGLGPEQVTLTGYWRQVSPGQ